MMRILVICSRREYASFTGYVAPFIYEQVSQLEALGLTIHYYLILGGWKGYYQAVSETKRIIHEIKPDVIHAHYGLCGFIANLQRRVPVVTTYHGSDLNERKLRLFSIISSLLSRYNIVVSKELLQRICHKKNTFLIPCGIDTKLLQPMDRMEARRKLGWKTDDIYILFSKEFHNVTKNYPLAKAAVDCYNRTHPDKPGAELIEFIGYSREQVLWLYNAVNCVIMTSIHEGSPQFIKEAMACNCPIVSVDVGDVKQVIAGVEGCFIAERTAHDLAEKLDLAIKAGRTEGRNRILGKYDSVAVARRIAAIYQDVVQ